VSGPPRRSVLHPCSDGLSVGLPHIEVMSSPSSQGLDIAGSYRGAGPPNGSGLLLGIDPLPNERSGDQSVHVWYREEWWGC
jgi:hypothetical protein